MARLSHTNTHFENLFYYWITTLWPMKWERLATFLCFHFANIEKLQIHWIQRVQWINRVWWCNLWLSLSWFARFALICAKQKYYVGHGDLWFGQTMKNVSCSWFWQEIVLEFFSYWNCPKSNVRNRMNECSFGWKYSKPNWPSRSITQSHFANKFVKAPEL